MWPTQSRWWVWGIRGIKTPSRTSCKSQKQTGVTSHPRCQQPCILILLLDFFGWPLNLFCLTFLRRFATYRLYIQLLTSNQQITERCADVKFWKHIQYQCSVTGLNPVRLTFSRNESYLHLVLPRHPDRSLWLSERYGTSVYVNQWLNEFDLNVVCRVPPCLPIRNPGTTWCPTPIVAAHLIYLMWHRWHFKP